MPVPVDRLLYRDAPLRLASRYRRVRGLRLHERAGGHGSALVCVHGIGVSGRYLLPTAARLARSHQVLVPDLPGFGRSPPARTALSVRGLGDWLLAWLDAAAIERAPLLANSFGCQVAVEVAARHAERVEALVLVGPTIDRHARSFPRQAVRLVADTLREPPGLWPVVTFDYATHLAKGGLRTYLEMLRDPVEEKLPLVEARTLVVRGGRDLLVSQRWAEEFAALLPRGRLLVVPTSPHAVHYDEPGALADAVLAFFAD